MHKANQVERMREDADTCAYKGRVVWSPGKSLWYFGHTTIASVGGALTFSWSAVAVFLLFTGLTLCLGHSLGMHRRLIHNSYQCPLWMEYLFVHFGVLVGLAGPLGMMAQHDLRDWAQRQRQCHDYLKHGSPFLKDGWWQLACDLKLEKPPIFQCEARVREDRIMQWMEKTWMWQQLPWALVLFLLGGWPWVIWGICARVSISITGHWLIGHFAHNRGGSHWHVPNAAVQGRNVAFTALLTMGECWHNNHHAFPGSAKLGLFPGQWDPGWWVLLGLKRFGLAWDFKLPEDFPERQKIVHQIEGNLSMGNLKVVFVSNARET